MIANTTSSSIESESKNIWIIDDDRSIRWVLEKALAKEGWNITTFESGDAALKQLKTSEPIAIVSDVRMPGINGIDLLKQLKKITPIYPLSS